ncbi:MAG: hypothetical protein CL526_00945 [Aequorivita sp.]|nr:hypothetical protein [Aequorivita sp.]|tara:strand:- start:636 stop:1151 length:516 start_codon:yes stop_codon:yes gene_type:complete
MSKAKLINRLRWYYPLEKFHAFVTFPLLTVYFLMHNPIAKSIMFVYGMIVCIAILYQGQRYWQLKLWHLQNKPFSQVKNLKFFRGAKRLNILLIIAMPVVFIIQVLVAKWSLNDTNIIFWTLLANLFAVLEYINYYHKQLMVDNFADVNYIVRNKKLKTASLAKDLNENSF